MRTYTTAQAAEAAGYPVKGFQAMMAKLRGRGGPDWRVAGHDARSPLWDADAVDAWAATLTQRRAKRTQPARTTTNFHRAPRHPDELPHAEFEAWRRPCPVRGCRGHDTLDQALDHARQLALTAHNLRLSVALTLLEDGNGQTAVRAATGLPIAEIRHLAQHGDQPTDTLAHATAYYRAHPGRQPGTLYPHD